MSPLAPFDLLEFSLTPNLGNRDCRNRLQEAYETLNELVRNGEGEFISNRFNLCRPIDTDDEDDVAAFYELSVRAVIDYLNTYQLVSIYLLD